jgi:hypothetical protein
MFMFSKIKFYEANLCFCDSFREIWTRGRKLLWRDFHRILDKDWKSSKMK